MLNFQKKKLFSTNWFNQKSSIFLKFYKILFWNKKLINLKFYLTKFWQKNIWNHEIRSYFWFYSKKWYLFKKYINLNDISKITTEVVRHHSIPKNDSISDLWNEMWFIIFKLNIYGIVFLTVYIHIRFIPTKFGGS